MVGLLAAVIVVGVSGAIAALGDTLFPSRTLAEALAADLSPTSHMLLRLRMLHPALAIATAALLAVTAPLLARRDGTRLAARLARGVAALAATQVVAGVVNVMLLAPVWMQLLHLLARRRAVDHAGAAGRGPVATFGSAGVRRARWQWPSAPEAVAPHSALPRALVLQLQVASMTGWSPRFSSTIVP